MDLASRFKLITEEDVKWEHKSFGWPNIDTFKTGGIVFTYPQKLSRLLVREQMANYKMCITHGRKCGKTINNKE